MAVIKARKTVKTTKAKATKARPIEDVLQEIRAVTEARYEIAQAVYDAQDNFTKEVIDRIRDRLRIASTGVIQVNGQPYKLEQKYVDYNLWFIATEILGDLALMDIQVASFEFSPAYCAECKKRIAKVPKPKGRRR